MVTLTGGDALARKLNELAAKLGKGGMVRVGFLEGSTNSEGESIPTYAALNNFGTGRIPPRPFFSNMIREKSPEWGRKFERVLKAANYDIPLALERMGEGIKGQLQESITNTNDPPLAASTIAAKGFDKVLIDTGAMFNSVGVEVKDTPS